MNVKVAHYQTLTRLYIVIAILCCVLALGTLFIAQSIADRELDKQARDEAIAAMQRPSLEIIP